MAESKSADLPLVDTPITFLLLNGGDDKDRTCDIQLAKLALSQLSYTPTKIKWRKIRDSNPR
jgi:hypothetical protein